MSEQTNDTTKFFRIRGAEPHTWECLKCEGHFYGPILYNPDATIVLTHCPKCGRRITHIDGREVIIEGFLPKDRNNLPIVEGKLVKPGDKLWERDSGKEWPVVEVTLYTDDYCICAESPRGDDMQAYSASKFTRVKPVVDHDGVKINVGDTVYAVNGIGTPLKVVGINSSPCRLIQLECEGGNRGTIPPDSLSHEPPDTWERIENDVDVNCCTYFKCESGICEDCQVPATESDCDLYKVHDLIRRAKALVRKESNE